MQHETGVLFHSRAALRSLSFLAMQIIFWCFFAFALMNSLLLLFFALHFVVVCATAAAIETRSFSLIILISTFCFANASLERGKSNLNFRPFLSVAFIDASCLVFCFFSSNCHSSDLLHSAEDRRRVYDRRDGLQKRKGKSERESEGEQEKIVTQNTKCWSVKFRKVKLGI